MLFVDLNSFYKVKKFKNIFIQSTNEVLKWTHFLNQTLKI